MKTVGRMFGKVTRLPLTWIGFSYLEAIWIIRDRYQHHWTLVLVDGVVMLVCISNALRAAR